MHYWEATARVGGGGVRVEENLNVQILARSNPCHVPFLKNEQTMQGWQKVLMRNSALVAKFLGRQQSASSQLPTAVS